MRLAFILACLAACAAANALRMPYQVGCDSHAKDTIHVLTFSAKHDRDASCYMFPMSRPQLVFDARNSHPAFSDAKLIEYAFCTRTFSGWECGGVLPTNAYFSTATVDCADSGIAGRFFPSTCYLTYTLGYGPPRSPDDYKLSQEAKADLAMSTHWPESADPRNYKFFKYVRHPMLFDGFIPKTPLPTETTPDTRSCQQPEVMPPPPQDDKQLTSTCVGRRNGKIESWRCTDEEALENMGFTRGCQHMIPEPVDPTPLEFMIYVFEADECAPYAGAVFKALLYSALAVCTVFFLTWAAGISEYVCFPLSLVFAILITHGPNTAGAVAASFVAGWIAWIGYATIRGMWSGNFITRLNDLTARMRRYATIYVEAFRMLRATTEPNPPPPANNDCSDSPPPPLKPYNSPADRGPETHVISASCDCTPCMNYYRGYNACRREVSQRRELEPTPEPTYDEPTVPTASEPEPAPEPTAPVEPPKPAAIPCTGGFCCNCAACMENRRRFLEQHKRSLG